MAHKKEHINDVVVQGQVWGPRQLSEIKESDDDYSNRQFKSIKSMKPKQVIKLCDEDGRFYLNEQHGEVLKVVIGEDTLSFKSMLRNIRPY